jgi:hypothetical protein
VVSIEVVRLQTLHNEPLMLRHTMFSTAPSRSMNTAASWASAGGGTRFWEAARQYLPYAVCCTKGECHSLCRRGPPESHERNHHSAPRQSHGQSFRTPDISERFAHTGLGYVVMALCVDLARAS